MSAAAQRVAAGARGIGAATARRLTADAIAPGVIETEMTRATAERMGVAFEALVQGAAAAIPVGRTGKPADIAHLVSFLAGEGAGFVSGQVTYAAGGPKA